MAIKTKISLSNSISSSGLDEFDSLMEDSLNSSISECSADNCSDSTETLGDVFINDKNCEKSNKKDKICPFEDDSIRNYDDINKKLIEIYNEFVSDTRITIANLSDIAQREAYIKSRWFSNMFAAKRHKKELIKQKEELKEKIRSMVSEKSKSDSFLTKKMSVDSIVNNDSNLKILQSRIDEADMIYELYKEYYEIIKGLGFQIRNSIDTLNFERGM